MYFKMVLRLVLKVKSLSFQLGDSFSLVIEYWFLVSLDFTRFKEKRMGKGFIWLILIAWSHFILCSY